MAHEPEHNADLMSPREVAEALHMARTTVHVWRYRGDMPQPALIKSGCPLWHHHEIVKWAAESGRLRPHMQMWHEAVGI